MKHLGRILVVSVILVIFARVYAFFPALERRADTMHRLIGLVRFKKVLGDDFSVPRCKDEFLISSQDVAKDACS